MKRLLTGVVVGFIVGATLLSPQAYALEQTVAQPPTPWLEQSPLLITARYTAGNQVGYLEIYNEGDEVQKIADWSLAVTWHDATGQPIRLAMPLFDNTVEGNRGRVPYLSPHGYAVVSVNDTVANALLPKVIEPLPSSLTLTTIALEHAAFRPYSVTIKSSDSGKKLRLTQGASSYNSSYAESNALYQDASFYEVPDGDFPLLPIEILAHPRSCAPSEVDMTCQEYVKFYNNTPTAVDFGSVRLRIGDQASAKSVRLAGVLAPGALAVFSADETGAPLTISNAGGYIWLEDRYGLKRFDSTIISFPSASATSKQGVSWASIDGTWQWAQPNPNGLNTPLPLQQDETGDGAIHNLTPCRSDQFRNPLTNRCKLIASSGSSLTPCASNQYRNPATGRCRLIASASSAGLTPCKVGQSRNPLTNRCRTTATTATALKPCAANQERNPTTNRCRKIAGAVLASADFPVQRSGSDETGAPIGWWAFGGVGLLAIGYGGWEWRYEVAAGFAKLKGLIVKI